MASKLLTIGLIGLAPRRKRAGFTQQTFADALGIERARLGNYEIGKSWPTAALLPAMADLLNCSIDDLYEPLPDDIVQQEEETLPCRTSAGTSTTTQGALPV